MKGQRELVRESLWMWLLLTGISKVWGIYRSTMRDPIS